LPKRKNKKAPFARRAKKGLLFQANSLQFSAANPVFKISISRSKL
jgi:hypothetical protein